MGQHIKIVSWFTCQNKELEPIPNISSGSRSNFKLAPAPAKNPWLWSALTLKKWSQPLLSAPAPYQILNWLQLQLKILGSDWLCNTGFSATNLTIKDLKIFNINFLLQSPVEYWSDTFDEGNYSDNEINEHFINTFF